MQVTRQFRYSFISFLREDWLPRNGIFANRNDEILSRVSSGVYRGRRNWIYYVCPDILGVNVPPVISDDSGVIDPSFVIHGM